MRHRNGTRKNRLRRLIVLMLLTLLLPAGALASETDPGETDRTLIVQVVEEIPAYDIEENQVPLAAYPDTPARSGVRHGAMMGLVLAAVIGYGVYFRRYDARLLRLRQEAALAEKRAAGRGKEAEP